MGHQLKKSDKVSKTDKISKTDKATSFIQKAIKISNEFKSVFDDVIIKGLNDSCYFIISVKLFGYTKTNTLNALCKKNKVSYFCLYNTKNKTFDFYLHTKN